jgi:HSP20 family protein
MFSLVPWKRPRSSEALAQRDPFQLMRSEFESLFDRVFGNFPISWSDGWDMSRRWSTDVEEKENEVVVRAELPGFDAKDINVQLTDNILTLEAKRTCGEGKEKEDGTRDYCHVRRSFTLTSGLDAEKVEATYRNGVLELHIPRLPEAQPRRIEIKS